MRQPANQETMWSVYFTYNKSDCGEVALGIIWAKTEEDACKQAFKWAQRNGGEDFEVFYAGEGPPPALVGYEDGERITTDQDIRRMVQKALRSRQSQFLRLVRVPYRFGKLLPVWFVDTLEEAMVFLREVGLPAMPLPEVDPKEFRRRWYAKCIRPVRRWLRGQYPNKRLPRTHLCPACYKGKKTEKAIYEFAWDLFHDIARPRPNWREIVQPDEVIALFFERCDLPVFGVQGRLLFDFEFSAVTDMYLTPLSDMRWIVSYDHEHFGPYYVETSSLLKKAVKSCTKCNSD